MTVDLLNYGAKSDSYDIRRIASVYYNAQGDRAWTTAWFNNHDKSERPVEVSLYMAHCFIRGRENLDEWLARFFPKQMGVYQKAMEQTRQQMLGI